MPRHPDDDHWHGNLRTTLVLLVVWFGVSFVPTFFARDLDLRFFGWPVSFWVAAQGAPLAYLAIVACHARALRWMDRRRALAGADRDRGEGQA